MHKTAAGVVVALCAAAALAGSAIGSSTSSTHAKPMGAASTAAEGFKVGLLLPDVYVPRYESKDKPYFQAKLKKLCPSCKLLYANAAADAAKQQQQADSLLVQGVKVLVVDPVDGVAAASIVNSARGRGVPVIAYDRLIKSKDLSFVISNDYFQVGRLQGTTLVGKLKADHVSKSKGGIVMLNGATTDNNALNIKKGALSVIKKSGYKVLASTDTWDPDAANKFVSAQASKYGDKIVAVYSANDGNAGGAIAALKAAGWKTMPPITGLDATIQAIQAILVGDQYETTYNAFRTEAERAAEVAYTIGQGKEPAAKSKVAGVPAFLNPPQAVTLRTIKSTVIKDGFYKASEICTRKYKTACGKAGLK